jgi:hypothetical protein
MWRLMDTTDVAHAVAAAQFLNKSNMWPSGRMLSAVQSDYPRMWTKEILRWPAARNRWPSHSKRAVFKMPRDAVEYLIDVWERRRVPDFNSLPEGLDGNQDPEDNWLEVGSNHAAIQVKCLNGVSIKVECSVVLSFRAFPPSGNQCLMFILCLDESAYRLDGGREINLGQQFSASGDIGLPGRFYLLRNTVRPDLCFLSLGDDATNEPLCMKVDAGMAQEGQEGLAEAEAEGFLSTPRHERSWVRGAKRNGSCYESPIYVEDLDSNVVEAPPVVPPRLRQWLQRLTTDGMRALIAFEDPSPL